MEPGEDCGGDGLQIDGAAGLPRFAFRLLVMRVPEVWGSVLRHGIHGSLTPCGSRHILPDAAQFVRSARSPSSPHAIGNKQASSRWRGTHPADIERDMDSRPSTCSKPNNITLFLLPIPSIMPLLPESIALHEFWIPPTPQTPNMLTANATLWIWRWQVVKLWVFSFSLLPLRRLGPNPCPIDGVP